MKRSSPLIVSTTGGSHVNQPCNACIEVRSNTQRFPADIFSSSSGFGWALQDWSAMSSLRFTMPQITSISHEHEGGGGQLYLVQEHS